MPRKNDSIHLFSSHHLLSCFLLRNMDLFDWKFEWNIENLSKTFQKILDVISIENDRHESSNRFYQFEEVGYEYDYASTGCNGTHYKWMKFPISNSTADEMAVKIYKATHDWPGWRCLDVDVQSFVSNGTISCALNGGHFDQVQGKDCDILHDPDGSGHKLVCRTDSGLG